MAEQDSGIGADGEPRLIGLQFDVEETPSTPSPPSPPGTPTGGTTGTPTGGTTGTPTGGTTGTTGAGTPGGAGTPLARTGFGATLPSLLATALVVGGGLLMITVARRSRTN